MSLTPRNMSNILLQFTVTLKRDSSLRCNSEIILKHKILTLTQISGQFHRVDIIASLGSTMMQERTKENN